jgi:hypothetical protein
MSAVSPREANVFACLVDTIVAPGGSLPGLAQTDALEFLDGYLAASPRPNRAGVRALLHALEVGPRTLGYGARLRQLPRERRLEFLDTVARSRAGAALQGLEVMAKMAYYGDDGVMRTLGYDPDAVVERAREIRMAEARW